MERGGERRGWRRELRPAPEGLVVFTLKVRGNHKERCWKQLGMDYGAAEGGWGTRQDLAIATTCFSLYLEFTGFPTEVVL